MESLNVSNPNRLPNSDFKSVVDWMPSFMFCRRDNGNNIFGNMDFYILCNRLVNLGGFEMNRSKVEIEKDIKRVEEEIQYLNETNLRVLERKHRNLTNLKNELLSTLESELEKLND